jgi:hypothetical protein
MLVCPTLAESQSFTHRGFIEGRAILYPYAAPNDSTRGVGDALFRYEASARARPWLTVSGAFDARADSHDQVDATWRVDWNDRGVKRPALSVRRLDVTFRAGRITLQVGKQFVRWGKADILVPTDRFAPRDFLTVVDNEFLAVTAARAIVPFGEDTVDMVWTPIFTPSRIPLITQRWTVLPPSARGLPLRDLGGPIPDGSQFGVRWNHMGEGYELSVTGFRGFNPLPAVSARFSPQAAALVFSRAYPRIGMIGADGAMPLRFFTVKAEAAYFTAATTASDEYVLYVIQIERQIGEWSLVGGYAGETVTQAGAETSFSPERGLGRSWLGRAGYTFDANRSAAFEGAVRQNGRGSWLKGEYSHASGQHLRTMVAGTWIRGAADDFLGQYERNSHVTMTMRWSF